MNPVTEHILALLRASGRPFDEQRHALSHTAAEAARARGTPLNIGGKSLVLKLGKRPDFGLFVVSGARRLDNRSVRHALGISRMRFATEEELLQLTGLRPGSVPPFGRPLFDLPLYVDTFTAQQPIIAFTLADHAHSAVMTTEDWLAVAKPEAVAVFSRER